VKIVVENLQIETLPSCTGSSTTMKELTSAKNVQRDSSKLLVFRYLVDIENL
jgi:hypothetical protein